MSDAVKLPPMPEKTAMSIAEHPPMYFEARRYCEDHKLPYEELERARQYLAVREWNKRIEPIQKQYANILAMLPSPIISDGYIRAATTIEQDGALKALEELMQVEAAKLGISLAQPEIS